jgi:hypothetical protein
MKFYPAVCRLATDGTSRCEARQGMSPKDLISLRFMDVASRNDAPCFPAVSGKFKGGSRPHRALFYPNYKRNLAKLFLCPLQILIV